MAAKKKAKPAAAKKASKPALKAQKPVKTVAKAAAPTKAVAKAVSKAADSKVASKIAAAPKAMPEKPVKGSGSAVKGGVTAKAAVSANGKESGANKKGYRPTEDMSLEERELGADPLDEETEVEAVEEEVEDTEGPPPWWKDDPTGIEGGADEAGAKKNFDDSDEWTEDDEDWSTRRGTLDELEGGSDEDERW
jgi:hypothetical protein